MGQTFSNLLAHIVYSTKDRAPLITPDLSPRLYAYIGAVLREHDTTLLEVGGIEDHIHLLILYPPRMAVADLVRSAKSNSSRRIREDANADFAWQNGYAVFSVSESNAPDVRKYIVNQREHHRTATFKDELLAFLERHGIAYDERYIWD